MTPQEAIKNSQALSTVVLKTYMSDLSDADLLRRPGPGCNHLAWQLGHLISAECGLLEMVAPGASVKLPEGFADKHSKQATESNDPAAFCTKQEYIDLLDKVQAATAAAIDKCSAADLDQPGPEKFRSFCPTVGSFFILIANHPMMHAGQFVPVRRALGKPVMM